MFSNQFSEANFQDLLKAISAAGSAIFLFIKFFNDIIGS